MNKQSLKGVKNKGKNEQKKNNKNNTSQKQTKSENKMRIIPLGGLGEIGKNITLYEYMGDMILIDCGMTFPDEDTPGVDNIIPDFTYVLENKNRIKGLFVTHGHEDHIGGIPYLLKEFNLPIYTTRLTAALIESKLKEHKLLNDAKINVIMPGRTVKAGKFSVEFIHVNHSIPDAVGFAVNCGAGTVIHTGDFKIDTTPIDGEMIDLARFAELGKQGVLALCADSTNVERPGYTASERVVGESFSNLFRNAQGHRIIVATFSSNIHRIQQIITEAAKQKRKVAVSGRSMINVVNIAAELGYLTIPKGVLIDIEDIKNYPSDKLVIVTTGSQGEPLSALHRIAFSEHRQVELIPGDMIIISATPIPGNEKLVDKVINELIRRGANVVYEKMYDVHVSGHACSEELKIVHSIVKPKFFIPLHGEEKHLKKHADLARSMGMKKDNILIASNGAVIELSKNSIKQNDTVQAGRVLVDGLGVGDVGSVVLRDRKRLAEDGILVITMSIDGYSREIVSGPDIVSRGFVFVKESDELMDQLVDVVYNAVNNSFKANARDFSAAKSKCKEAASKFLYQKTRRSPIILPVIMEV
ncbi:MAG: ribonuclease J [Clostridia bacterium]|nr:ribonuclease J [Clostridia bacterium]